MADVIEATYDGKALQLDEPLQLEPNTRVRIIIDSVLPANGKTASFLDTALSLSIDGPPDWSENLDHYLYGHFTDDKPDETDLK